MENSGNNYWHVLKYTSLFGGVQGLGILISLVRNKLVALILGPDGMGLNSLFNSTLRLVSDGTGFGISTSGTKNVSEHFSGTNGDALSHSIKLIRSLSLISAVLGMMVCLVFSPWLNEWTFSWGDHTLHFMCLSPVVALMAITGGEMAILKGTRQLQKLARIYLFNIIGALVTSVPILYFFGMSGIVPSIIIVAVIQMLITIGYSYRLYPLEISLKRSFLLEGIPVLKLGAAFMIAGIFGSGAEFVVRSYLNNVGGLGLVGLYNAGFMMCITYAGMVFSAMETDYFPRLSAIKGTGPELNDCVNKQVEVSLLLLAPMLAFFLTGLPLLLPLLFSGKFMPALDMMRITILGLYLRAVKLPMAYIPLAKGDSKSYMFLEGAYYVAFVILVVIGYNLWGLTGTGVAIAVCALLDFCVLIVFMNWRYGYSISRNVIRVIMVQYPMGILVFVATLLTSSWVYWILGIGLSLLSLAWSIYVLHSKAHLWKALMNRWRGMR